MHRPTRCAEPEKPGHPNPQKRPSRLSASGTAALAVLVSVGLASCGNLTAGGFGEARVVASGDARIADTGSVLFPSTGALPAPQRTAHGDSDDDFHPEGEIELEFRLFLQHTDGRSVALSDQDLEIELDLDGSFEVDVVRARVPTGRYRALRVVFLEIEVQVDAGVVINGVPVAGPIDIEFEGPGLEVTRTIDLTIRDGESVDLLLDLNAERWLRAIDPVTLTVSPTVFAEAFQVVVRR